MIKSEIGNSIPKMEIELFGDWDEAIETFQNLKPKIKIASIKAQWKVCKEVEKKIKQHLINQDLNWKGLNVKYKARKSSLGLDGDILYAYGNYSRAIHTWENPGSSFVYVGVKKGIFTKTLSGKQSRIDISSIAYIHEFSKKIARPLWNPTIEEMGGSIGLQAMYMRSLIFWLKFQKVKVKSSILPFPNAK